MNSAINRLTEIFRDMVANAAMFGCRWKNIELAKEAFTIMRSLPDAMPGEFESPADKAEILEMMLDRMIETDSPRFCIEVRKYIHQLSGNEENKSELSMLQDYINLDIPMEEFCRKHHRHLKFDPVERTEAMENIIVDVERECAEKLAGLPRSMGFCYAYWSIRQDVLKSYGIKWRSPGIMNPGVLFD